MRSRPGPNTGTPAPPIRVESHRRGHHHQGPTRPRSAPPAQNNDGPLVAEQVPDWRRAGPRRLARLVRSARTLDLETTLTGVRGHVYVAHAEHDVIGSHAWGGRP